MAARPRCTIESIQPSAMVGQARHVEVADEGDQIAEAGCGRRSRCAAAVPEHDQRPGRRPTMFISGIDDAAHTRQLGRSAGWKSVVHAPRSVRTATPRAS